MLQNRLEVKPALPADEIFSTSDPNYEGPELPPRYSDLVLPSDWYVPGKGRRKKRQHVGEFLSRGFCLAFLYLYQFGCILYSKDVIVVSLSYPWQDFVRRAFQGSLRIMENYRC